MSEVWLKDQERTRCEIWTRVMGYHRPLTSFNTGKLAEHAERVPFTEKGAVRGLATALVLTLFLGLGGCSITPTREDVGEAIDRTTALAVDFNDKKMEVSELSLCASPLSAILRNYGQDPDKLKALLTLCGWSSYNIEGMIGDWRYTQ